MLNLYLEKLEDAEKLVSVCRKYVSDINVMSDRYIVDGKSTLGVMALLGKYVTIEMITEDEKEHEKFVKEIEVLSEKNVE